MTQRSQNNPRNQARMKHGDGIKGVTRKSAGSAKIASKAGSSVYTKTSKSAAASKKSKLSKAADEDEKKAQRQRERRREQALGAQLNDMPEYKKWRRIWWIVLVVAVVAVAISFLIAQLRNTGQIEGQIADTVSIVTLIVGYAGIIGALIIDLGKIRGMRKKLQAQAHTMSKKQLRELDAAIDAGDKAYEEQRKQRKSRMPWSKKDEKAAEEAEDTKE